MPLRTLSRRGRAVLGATLLLALALALAQTLGLVHRIVHVPLLLQGAAGTLAPARAAVGATASPETQKSALQALFIGHAFEHGCDLYDQASHADMLGVAVLVAAALDLPSQTLARTLPTWYLAAQAAGFLARGPPVVTS